MTTPTVRLDELGIRLPLPPNPSGSYVPVLVHDGTAFVSGQIILENGVAVHPGRVGESVEPAAAKEIARRAALQALSALSQKLGSLDRVKRILRVAVFVASAPTFVRQHEVANGATEVLIEIFGEGGRPARAAVGVVSLPLNAPVELEMLVATD